MREWWDEWGGPSLVMLGIVAAVLFVVGFGFWALPRWNVYNRTLAGEAALREAELTRQIAALDAVADLERAKGQADAEIERARGVAEANRIIGASLQGNEEYLRYRYIVMLEATGQGGARETVYIPTEAGMPILEAGRIAPIP